MESKMGHKLQYGVRFIGYLAQVIARKYGREIDYAQVDFVTGSVSIHADGGWVTVQNRTDLEPFLKTLPDRQVPAERVASTGTASDMISMSSGQNTVWIAPGTEVSRFIRQIARRFTEIEQVLEQAEQIGSRIKRRPYDEYIEEIGETGLCRVESHGLALFIDGRLIFYPSHEVFFVKQQGPTSLIFPLDEASKTNFRPN